LRLAVHYKFSYPNARHFRLNGIEYLMFADAMPAWLSIPTGNSLDVVAHEFGHGIVQTLARLFVGDNINDPLGEAQSAALNEGFSDFSAVLVDIHTRSGAVTAATWEIAEIFATVPYALRSWSQPLLTNEWSRDWFPERSLGRADASKHANATIMGHAYKLLVEGGYHYRAGSATAYGGTIPYIYVSLIGHERAKQIFYWAFQSAEMKDFGNFFNAQHATEQEALTRFGEYERLSVSNAWRAVGLGYGCATPPSMPLLQIEDFFCQGRYRVFWNPVAGATKYNMERVPAGWSWTYATTITDAYVHECSQRVSSTFRYRLRACNGCGCSSWTPAVTLQYYPICY
jgi:Zn-dependent metalloprotease